MCATMLLDVLTSLVFQQADVVCEACASDKANRWGRGVTQQPPLVSNVLKF